MCGRESESVEVGDSVGEHGGERVLESIGERECGRNIVW